MLEQRSSGDRRVRSSRTATTTAATILLLHNSLHNLTSCVEHNIHQSIQWRVRIRFLCQALTNTFAASSLRHILCEVADNGAHTSDFLYNVSEIVDDKVEGFAALCDRAEEAVDGADDV